MRLEPDSELARLLAKARVTRLPESLESMLCHQVIALAKTGDGADRALSLAMISLFGEEGYIASNEHGDARVLFADPVHMQLQRDSFTLWSSVPLPLAQDEASALIDALNAHFVDDGLDFLVGGSGHWYVRIGRSPEIETRHPESAIGRDVHGFLPSGPDAVRWKSLSNEIQMLLHMHPVNQRREERGLLTCNSLWFWGDGRVVPRLAHESTISVFGETSLINGLTNLGYVDRKESLSALAGVNDGEAVFCWLNEAAVVESSLKIAVDGLKRGMFHDLRINIADRGDVCQASLGRWDMYKFWKRPRAVREILLVSE